MHLINITDENPLGLEVGIEYLAEDVNAGDILVRGWGKVRSSEHYPEKLFNATLDWNEKKILFVRPGGFGDLLFLTPTFREIKRRWPTSEIYVACFDRYRPALENNSDVSGTPEYPVPTIKWDLFDAQIWLEGIIEESPAARMIHAVDLVAARCGIRFTEDREGIEARRMRYYLRREEEEKARDEFPRGEQSRVGLQMTASGNCRVYPRSLELARALWREGYEVFLFGGPGEVKTDEPEGIVNVMSRNKSFRESCAILATCDVLVGPDSALVHVAGAMMKQRAEWEEASVPCVALYGPFPWRLRTAYAEHTFALQGVCPVSPCFHHPRPGRGDFPANGPCAVTGRCEALASIPPARIVREVEKKIADSRNRKPERQEVLAHG